MHSNFGNNWHFLAPCGQVFLKNHKRWRKSIDMLLEALVILKQSIEEIKPHPTKIKILYTYQMCEISTYFQIKIAKFLWYKCNKKDQSFLSLYLVLFIIYKNGKSYIIALCIILKRIFLWNLFQIPHQKQIKQ